MKFELIPVVKIDTEINPKGVETLYSREAAAAPKEMSVSKRFN